MLQPEGRWPDSVQGSQTDPPEAPSVPSLGRRAAALAGRDPTTTDAPWVQPCPQEQQRTSPRPPPVRGSPPAKSVPSTRRQKMTSAPAPRFRVQGLFLALLCSFTCFQGTVSGQKLHAGITSSLQIDSSFGKSFRVPCEGYSVFDSGIIYWLANGTFVEDLYPDDAVIEEAARRVNATVSRVGDTRPHFGLQRGLFFRSFSEQDLQTTFKCIILDPAGSTQKTLIWLLREADGPRSGGSASGGLEEP